jgi:hypothetical protein
VTHLGLVIPGGPFSQSAFTLPGTDSLAPMAPRIIVPTDLATKVSWLQSRSLMISCICWPTPSK